ncbi:hypothetical protein [Acetobacter senegalensis]|uniref:hypothetical protein n=1 Tax=Acetobacter senegalensis TaxID=446692 RepID=UPI00264CD2D5|nr:hypothetical protein [Acetobacter senegalensis]MDN7351782.1 hypothetical protein [Acetobacter senegalensis]
MNEKIRPQHVDVDEVISNAKGRVWGALEKKVVLGVDVLIRSSEDDVNIGISEFENGDYQSAASCMVDGAVNLLLVAICFQRMANAVPAKSAMN